METEKNQKQVLEKVKENLSEQEARKISVKEGCFATVQSAFGESYISPFAIAVNSSNSQIAMLTSIPGLLGPLSQVFGSKLIEKYSRKKIVIQSLLLQILMWIPIMALAFLFWKGILTNIIPVMLIVFYSAYAFFANIAGPAWFSWMGDIVKEEERGRYFSNRNKICGAVSVICALIAAFALDFFKRNSFLLLGFVIFFAVAMFARTISRELFKKQYEPKFELKKGYYFTIWQFIKRMPSGNFGKFTLFRSLLSFVTAIAGPFFAVYMLRNLNFSYVDFMIVTISSAIFSLIAMPLWGKFSDKFGNYETIKLTSVFVISIPLLWMVHSSPYYLALVPELISGVGWAGFNLATGNYIYDCVTPQKRGIVISYYNLLNGIGVFLGATFGAFLSTTISTNLIDPLLIIFLVSGLGRLLICATMIRKIKEIRQVKEFSSTKALKHLIFQAYRTINGYHQLMSTHYNKGAKVKFPSLFDQPNFRRTSKIT